MEVPGYLCSTLIMDESVPRLNLDV
jgi:hypothetical protein